MSRQRYLPGWVPTVGAAMLSVVVSACVQTSRNDSRLPEPNSASGVVATSDPLVLNGVASSQNIAKTESNSGKRPPPNADIVAVPAGGASGPVGSSGVNKFLFKFSYVLLPLTNLNQSIE